MSEKGGYTMQIIVHEHYFRDRAGLFTTVWAVYYKDRIINVEFTRGRSGLTDRVEMPVAA
jgi:hypothetical protein